MNDTICEICAGRNRALIFFLVFITAFTVINFAYKWVVDEFIYQNNTSYVESLIGVATSTKNYEP